MLIREPLRFSTGRGVKRKVLNRTIGDGPDCKNLSVIRSSKGFGHSSMFFCQLRKKFFFFFFFCFKFYFFLIFLLDLNN
jgi:hypothetical protein